MTVVFETDAIITRWIQYYAVGECYGTTGAGKCLSRCSVYIRWKYQLL